MSDKKKIKQIVAIVLVVLIIIVLIATLVVAIVPFPGSDNVFMGLVGLDILLPVITWFYMWLFKRALNVEDRNETHLNSKLKELDKKIKESKQNDK